jgi:hypothetical protein
MDSGARDAMDRMHAHCGLGSGSPSWRG